MQYKFVQISDICFNHSITWNSEINKLIESIREEAFENTINLCIEEKATALIICGNLYDESNLTLHTVQLLKHSFNRLKANNIAIVYAHGKLDKGALVKNLKKEVFDFSTGYSSNSYTLGFDLDRVDFIGMGYSRMLMMEDEFMDAGSGENLTIGLMYVDKNVYNETMTDTIRKRLQKSKADYWAIGGEPSYIAYDKKKKYCSSGSLSIVPDNTPSCAVVRVNNKKRITTNKINVSNYVFKEISVVSTDNHGDVYSLVEDCVMHILNNKDLKKKNIIKLNIKGPSKCYINLTTHLEELEKEIARLTDVNLYININELYKKVEITKALKEETDITNLLEQYEKLYDDEAFNHMIFSLQSRGALYLQNDQDIDRNKLLEGVDSMLVESRKNNKSTD